MKLLALIAAAYLGLVLESTILPELFGAARCGILLWPIVPFIALLLPTSTGIVFAMCYGLTIDALGGGRLGVCSILCVLGVLTVHRTCSATVLLSFSRTLGLTFVTSVALSMTLFVAESVLHWGEQSQTAPSGLLAQILLASLSGAVIAGLISTPLRIVGMKRANADLFATR